MRGLYVALLAAGCGFELRPGGTPSVDATAALSNGQNGRGDATAALGGTGTGALAGGAGGVESSPTGRRGLPDTTTSTDGSGGGGGGVGRIYLRSRAGGIVMNGGIVSPTPVATGTDFLQ